ncbi:MAG: STAS domain-containing protein [Spirochaetes bacterium]|nr:STAS domain-containing protein [Spirochaetota bacterium]
MKLEGDVSIKKVKQVYSVLKDELKSSKDVVIDMSGVVSIDAAIAQVLLSATIKAKEMGKELRLDGIPAGLNNTLALAGLVANTVQGGHE